MRKNLFNEALTTTDPAEFGRSLAWDELFAFLSHYGSGKYDQDADFISMKEKLLQGRVNEINKPEYQMLSASIINTERTMKSMGFPFLAAVLKGFRDHNRTFGELSDTYGNCFVATAVYGSYNAPEVYILRQFRDSFLRTNFLGRGFIKLYYIIGPTLANITKRLPLLRSLVKSLLDRFVYLLKRRH